MPLCLLRPATHGRKSSPLARRFPEKRFEGAGAAFMARSWEVVRGVIAVLTEPPQPRPALWVEGGDVSDGD